MVIKNLVIGMVVYILVMLRMVLRLMIIGMRIK